eukprot:XP_001689437.1 predicted protein [Chlamydomonas reinhardtii]
MLAGQPTCSTHRLQKILKMSTPPKLQMSDIPQELIDQLKDLVRKEVRAELQKKEPPRDWLGVLAGPVGTSSCCGRTRGATRRYLLSSRLSCC